MREKTLFLRWLLFTTLVLLGVVILHRMGIFAYIANADVTKLSFLIMLIFFATTLVCGHVAWRMGNSRPFPSDKKEYEGAKIAAAKEETDELALKIDGIWFNADICEYIGLGGTILGFLFLFVKGNILDLKLEDLKQLSQVIWSGSGTALLTTIVGLTSMVLLKIQAHALEIALRRKSRK
ncbi:MAG: hypothetical protein COU47_02665 [Candidatus Niyogibacteria bacterium CG10_big_fil_rev_8_21_14_0_10_46_36]|uniref:MotA/TolQ/ExbB proton channel domain-containing protein n=1 Tax=Candidatus Niyogibacteria bacterium CG10_big_fil_rev_8_21_14_0_10_46_36 TaxID=1974726 RepID=A0A2H0TD45_9BACT|nr:MAG: hypothetical protein COU47_02665 [Candidatus Niyogibacteria bacterium CG10_big_fil_rev_8_21_14_0_10_46_36]